MALDKQQKQLEILTKVKIDGQLAGQSTCTLCKEFSHLKSMIFHVFIVASSGLRKMLYLIKSNTVDDISAVCSLLI